MTLNRRVLPYVPGIPTLSLPDGSVTRDDAHTLLTGLQAWAPGERIRCRFTADPGVAQFQSGYGYQHAAISRHDLAAGYLVSCAAVLGTEALESVTATVTMASSGDTPPAALWWLERQGTDVVVRLGSRYAQALPGNDYACTLTLTGSGGANWQTILPLLRCRG
jgi:hypothetical protein